MVLGCSTRDAQAREIATTFELGVPRSVETVAGGFSKRRVEACRSPVQLWHAVMIGRRRSRRWCCGRQPSGLLVLGRFPVAHELPADMRRATGAGRWAAIVTWIQALMFGLPAVPVSAFVLREHRLPWLWDLFPMYGGPWSDVMSDRQLVLALWLFLLVSALASYGGWLLWRGRRSGALVLVGSLPVEALFWWGFALPFPVVGGLLRLGLVVKAWPRLKEDNFERD